MAPGNQHIVVRIWGRGRWSVLMFLL